LFYLFIKIIFFLIPCEEPISDRSSDDEALTSKAHLTDPEGGQDVVPSDHLKKNVLFVKHNSVFNGGDSRRVNPNCSVPPRSAESDQGNQSP